MAKSIKIFRSFEEQERYFLDYFFQLNPSQRLKALADLQKKNYKGFNAPSAKIITIKKDFSDGYRK